MPRRRLYPAVHEAARLALMETLERMRQNSSIYAENMARLSTDSGKSGPVYGMFLAGKTGLEPETVKRICLNLKASRRQVRTAAFLLAAWKWGDPEVAAALLEASGADVSGLVKAAEDRAETARGRPPGDLPGAAAARRQAAARGGHAPQARRDPVAVSRGAQ
jgi:hypothetical protein